MKNCEATFKKPHSVLSRQDIVEELITMGIYHLCRDKWHGLEFKDLKLEYIDDPIFMLKIEEVVGGEDEGHEDIVLREVNTVENMLSLHREGE